MKLVIGLCASVALAAAAAVTGIAAWTGHLGRQDANLRTIHYDTNYDLSAQRRIPAEVAFTPAADRPFPSLRGFARGIRKIGRARSRSACPPSIPGNRRD